MSYRRGLSLSKAISYVLLILVLAAVIMAVAYFTDGCTKDFQTFYVTSGGSKIMERGSVVVSSDEAVRFDVKYTFGILGGGETGFSVKVVPNVSEDNNFEFEMDGNPYLFSGEKDLTAAFDVKLYDDYFTVNLHGSILLGDILSKVHSDKVVKAPNIIAEVGYMTLVVTSYDGKSNIYIDIGVSVAMQIIIEGGDLVF